MILANERSERCVDDGAGGGSPNGPEPLRATRLTSRVDVAFTELNGLTANANGNGAGSVHRVWGDQLYVSYEEHGAGDASMMGHR